MMGIKFMQIVDRWIGIPICFVLSIFAFIGRILGSKRRAYTGTPQKILFIEVTEMGTAIVAQSSLQRAKKLYPNSELYFLIFKELRESVDILDIISKENVLTLRGHSFIGLAFDTLKCLWKCRREGIDTVIDLEFFSRYSTIFSYLSGAKRRVGFHRFHTEGLYRGNLLTHRVQFNAHLHTAQMYLAVVNSLVAPQGQVPLTKEPVETLDNLKAQYLKITSSTEQKKVIWDKIKQINPKVTEKNKIVLVNPNSSMMIPLRRWPLSSYSILVKKLLQDPNVVVVVTGVASEKDNAQEICNFVKNDRCIDFTGQVTLRQLVDLYNVSQALITNDSGPIHFASLTNIKLFVFFGPETPTRYFPLTNNCEVFYSNFACSPCVTAENGLRSPCKNNLCLKAIQLDGVYTKVKKAL